LTSSERAMPEVGDLRLAVAVQEDVLRLHVAVDETVRVREGETARDLQRELDSPVDRQRALAVDELLQVLAVDELEDDERRPPSSPRSITVTMFWCSSPATMRASRRKRSTYPPRS
jgi:hypothetical protein